MHSKECAFCSKALVLWRGEMQWIWTHTELDI